LNPCSFNGYESEWKAFTLRGTGDAKKCAREVNRLIPHHQDTTEDIATIKTVGGVSHPPIRGHFFAMSLFFFTLDCLRELSGHETLNDTWPTPKIADLTEALDILCSRDWKDVSFIWVGHISIFCIISLILIVSFPTYRTYHKFQAKLTNLLDLLFYLIVVLRVYTW
jgi:hypothetical protein